jgi:hypothetical protein
MHNRYRYLRQAGKARDRASCQRSPVESRNVDACELTWQGYTGGRREEDDCIGMRHKEFGQPYAKFLAQEVRSCHVRGS